MKKSIIVFIIVFLFATNCFATVVENNDDKLLQEEQPIEQVTKPEQTTEELPQTQEQEILENLDNTVVSTPVEQQLPVTNPIEQLPEVTTEPGIEETVVEPKYTDITDDMLKFFKNNVVLGIGSKKTYIDGYATMIDMYPIIEEERTLVPLRFIAEAFGGTVDFKDETQTATIKIDENVIQITVGEKYIIKDNEVIFLDVPAQAYNYRIMLPIRKISELLNKNIHFDNYVITIGDKIFFNTEDMGKIGKYVLPIIDTQTSVADFIHINGKLVVFKRNDVYTKINLGEELYYKIDLLVEHVYDYVTKHNESKQKQTQSSTDKMYLPTVIGTTTYYLRTGDNYLCKVDEQDVLKKEKVIVNQYVTDYDIVNGYVYYNIANDTGLYKVDLNGQGTFKIID